MKKRERKEIKIIYPPYGTPFFRRQKDIWVYIPSEGGFVRMNFRNWKRITLSKGIPREIWEK